MCLICWSFSHFAVHFGLLDWLTRGFWAFFTHSTYLCVHLRRVLSPLNLTTLRSFILPSFLAPVESGSVLEPSRFPRVLLFSISLSPVEFRSVRSGAFSLSISLSPVLSRVGALGGVTIQRLNCENGKRFRGCFLFVAFWCFLSLYFDLFTKFVVLCFVLCSECHGGTKKVLFLLIEGFIQLKCCCFCSLLRW